MGTFTDCLLAGAKRTRGYAERLLKDVRPDQFARKPIVGGVTIDTNHPAFVFGHLALYPAKIAVFAGLDPAPFAVPAGFDDLFKDKAPCLDDPQGTIYPAMEPIVAAFFRNHDALLAVLGTVPDEVFARETPDARYRENFPLVGTVVAFMLANHNMMHFGQISAWRRCMGLGPA